MSWYRAFIALARPLVAAMMILAPKPGHAQEIDPLEPPIGTEIKFRYVYEEDARMDYVVHLLQEAFATSAPQFGAYTMRSIEEHFSRRREIQELIAGDRLNLLWAPALPSLKGATIQISVPILEGLGGYRILLVQDGDQAKFAAINDLEGLKNLTAGQGAGWQDVDILEHNGLPVTTAPEFAALFRMLSHGRFDYFPRGANEVLSDYATFHRQYPNLVIERHLLIQYPKPVFFFVSKQAPEIAARLEAGMQELKANSRLHALWREHHAELLEKLALDKRTVIRLENPFEGQEDNEQ